MVEQKIQQLNKFKIEREDSLFDLFPIILCYNHTDTSCNHKNSNGKEEPKEPLGIVTEIAAIIFLVAFTNFLPFISKHGINLTGIILYLFW